MRTLLTFVALTLVSTVATAGPILDDFSSVTSGGSLVMNIDGAAGCPGPAAASGTGTNIMGSAASGFRFLTVSRTSGTDCLSSSISGGTFNFTSDALAQGFTFLTGQGASYVVNVLDLAFTLDASHSLAGISLATIQPFLHIAGTGAIPGGTYVGAVAAPITSTSLSPYIYNLAAFTIGGTIAAGTVIDGYALLISGSPPSSWTTSASRVRPLSRSRPRRFSSAVDWRVWRSSGAGHGLLKVR